jgi:hypothetical protein
MFTTKFRATRLSYANVMATIAVFIALGGGAYAAFTLPPNSVGTKQLKDSAVTKKKLAPEQSFIAPTLASGVTAIGPPNPPFTDPGYMKDNFGFVHLKGTYNCGGTLGRLLFQLPSGYRPSRIAEGAAFNNSPSPGFWEVFPSGSVQANCGTTGQVSLDGVIFPAAGTAGT